MRDARRLILFLLVLVFSRTNAFTFSITDIPWESSFEAAKARAKQENKPILLLHVFGRLDQEFT
ncbi:thioredoxin family protein [bacterium]|nr:thioredoxin family protein [bacterium]